MSPTRNPPEIDTVAEASGLLVAAVTIAPDDSVTAVPCGAYNTLGATATLGATGGGGGGGGDGAGLCANCNSGKTAGAITVGVGVEIGMTVAPLSLGVSDAKVFMTVRSVDEPDVVAEVGCRSF